MFRKLQMLKKGVETIKKVAPSVGSALGKKKVDLLKKMGKTQRKSPENFKKAGGDKLKKEILSVETINKLGVPGRVKKFFGGRIKKKKPETKEQIKGDSGKQKKKAPFDAKDKPKSIREKIAPKKKMERLEELRKELK